MAKNDRIQYLDTINYQLRYQTSVESVALKQYHITSQKKCSHDPIGAAKRAMGQSFESVTALSV